MSSLIGYLEWGTHNSSFLFQTEYEVIVSLLNNPKSAAHPFTLIPLLGQLLLLITLFQKQPSKILTFSGIICLGILLGFMFVISLFSLNYKIFISTLPFFITTLFIFKSYKQPK